MKKTIALLLALVMVFALAGTSAFAAPVEVTIFNSKMEIQDRLLELQDEWNDSHDDIHIDVMYSSDTVAAHMSTKYASNDPYVISMVDAKDIFSLGPDHALDLTGEPWVENTTQAISIDGKVLGFPVYCLSSPSAHHKESCPCFSRMRQPRKAPSKQRPTKLSTPLPSRPRKISRLLSMR